MSLPKISINNHVLTWSLSLVIVLFGLVSFTRVGVEKLPDVEFPVLVVSTLLPGAAPDTVAKSVTSVIEEALATIDGIDQITSNSSSSVSQIVLQFALEKDLDVAFNDVQAKLAQISRRLPDDAESPVTFKFDVSSQPVVWMSLSGGDPTQLLYTAENLRTSLQLVPGVGEIRIAGTKKPVINIKIDEDRLVPLNLTLEDVSNAFRANHLQGTAGKVEAFSRDFQIKADFEATTVEQINSIPIARINESPVLMRDIAEVSYGFEDIRTFASYKQKNAVAIGVVKQSGTNAVQVINAVKEKIPQVQKQLDALGMTLVVASDDAKPIEDIVATLKSHLIEGIILTALIVFLFLRSVRALLIICLALPVSLIGAVGAFYVLDYTFNSISLLALLLLIGVVVDDAIVVLENIYKRFEEFPDADPKEIAEKATKQVQLAVAASTLTLISIFGPVIFLPGIIGKFFQAFAVIVVVGILISWFVALTLTPMLCSRYLRVKKSEGIIASSLEKYTQKLEELYATSLKKVINKPKITLGLTLLAVLPVGFIAGQIPGEFSPASNSDRVRISVQFPIGTLQGEVETTLNNLIPKLDDPSKVSSVLATFNDSQGRANPSANIFVTLNKQRDFTQVQYLAETNKMLKGIPGVRASASPGDSIGGGPGGRSDPFQFVLTGPSFDEVAKLSDEFVKSLRQQPAIGSLFTDLSTGSPQIDLILNRELMGSLGVTASSISQAVALSTGQQIVGRYSDETGQRRDILIQGNSQREGIEKLKDIPIKSFSGDLINLGSFTDSNVQGTVSTISKTNQQFAVAFYGSPASGFALGDAVAAMERESEKLPIGFNVQLRGEAEEFKKTGTALATVFGAALILLYLVLASQFNNWTQPFLVMLAQPFAVLGSFVALWLTGQTLNIFSMIGLILLIGLVAKNGILMVDRFNQIRDENDFDEIKAILLACPERLRPVLMTSLTVILSLLPAALGLGPGAENNAPLAISIIGGMFTATLLTLYVIPVATVWHPIKNLNRKLRNNRLFAKSA